MSDDLLNAAIARLREMREALEGLVDRLDQIHDDPAYRSVWTSYMIHGGRYDGPTYVDALARAREALNLFHTTDPSPSNDPGPAR